MSGGGLLEKAMGQQMSSEGESMVDEVVAEALPQPLPRPPQKFGGGVSSSSENDPELLLSVYSSFTA